MGADYKHSRKSMLAGIEENGTAANATVYVAPNGAIGMNAAIRAEIPVPHACLLRNLYYRTQGPPGAGETFTITVMVNTIATAITTQIAGAVQVDDSDLVNNTILAAGDRVCVRIVTSLNAAVTYHKWGIEVVDI